MASTVYHVTWDEESEMWRVKKEGNQRATSKHRTKHEAMLAARELVKNNIPGQVIAHRKDASIQDVATYER
jgi:hypothetical protein